ncbi:ABC-type sugar transport system, periplasmic component [Renibacterium salmoninarum ATCC 33209]|uniref:ABC-type sugar transport system, periplasmic component n=1 Tax=Renibacterium salmoninarum (strain ATCC 33209 / DSM 20767 / JCM 11484 / NBRC 15589 / NCIMB 2235) TaxID=288705 RepID=A9WKR4_RENSM|nr:ABC-type sugar transport system, periplasmic component [Renibacterium salmoninarum ATCC 33209]
MAGCGQRAPSGTASAGPVTLPQYLPAKDFTPDLPGSSDGVPAAFYNYPAPYKTVTSAPLSGQKYSATTLLFGPVANSRDNNPAWQEIEKRLGGSIELTAVSSDDYATKFNTQVASGNLPDLMFNDSVAIKDIVGFLESSCADLTPFLSGENIKQYPNLAAIPEVYWQACVQAGKIYFLPIPRGLTGGSGFFNETLLKQAGVDSTEKIKNKDDFTALLKELTRPDQNQWALGSTGFGLPTLHHIFRSPYQWRWDQKNLVKDFETDEYLAAIEYAAELYKAGYYCPGSDGWTKSQMVNAFVSGKVTMIYDGLPAYLSSTGYAQSLPQANASYKALPILPFGHDGGKGQAWIDNVVVGTTMGKRLSQTR